MLNVIDSRYYIEKRWVYRDHECVVVATRMGHRCGYVAVKEGHPFFGISHDQVIPWLLWNDLRNQQIGSRGLLPILFSNLRERPTAPSVFIDVHGGISFSGRAEFSIKESNLWWFGFDCAHFDDSADPEIIPHFYSADQIEHLHSMFFLAQNGIIRSLEFCEKECERLSKQLSWFEEGKETNMETGKSLIGMNVAALLYSNADFVWLEKVFPPAPLVEGFNLEDEVLTTIIKERMRTELRWK